MSRDISKHSVQPILSYGQQPFGKDIVDTEPTSCRSGGFAQDGADPTFGNVRYRSAFDNAKAGNDFDAWRQIVVPGGPRSEQRLHAMHNDVARPSASKRLADVEGDLGKWESDLDEYYRCGGDRLGERTMVLTAKTKIPPSTDAAVWLAIKGCETYADFRTTLRGCTQYLIDHGVGNAARAHLVDI